MAGDTADAPTFLASLDAKLKALQDLRTAWLAAQAVGALGPLGEGAELPTVVLPANGETGVPSELPKGAFLGKSLPQCITLHLSAVRKKQTMKEITAALRVGGVESTSPDFGNVVNAAIQRMKKNNEILRFKDGYGLASWYPPNFRASAPSPQRTKGKAAKKSHKKPKAAKSVRQQEPAAPEKVGSESQVLAYFKKHAGKEVSKAAIVSELGMRVQTASLILAKLAHKQILTKTESGNYKMAAA